MSDQTETRTNQKIHKTNKPYSLSPIFYETYDTNNTQNKLVITPKFYELEMTQNGTSYKISMAKN